MVDEHQEQVIALCKKYSVDHLYLFGSAARSDFRPGESDFDFLVRFLPCDPGAHSERYFSLLADLQDLFDAQVDLVEIDAVKNRYFKEEIERTRLTLYAA